MGGCPPSHIGFDFRAILYGKTALAQNRKRSVLDAVVSTITNTGQIGLVALLILGAIFAFFFPTTVGPVFGLAISIWVYGTFGSFLYAVLAFIGFLFVDITLGFIAQKIRTRVQNPASGEQAKAMPEAIPSNVTIKTIDDPIAPHGLKYYWFPELGFTASFMQKPRVYDMDSDSQKRITIGEPNSTSNTTPIIDKNHSIALVSSCSEYTIKKLRSFTDEKIEAFLKRMLIEEIDNGGLACLKKEILDYAKKLIRIDRVDGTLIASSVFPLEIESDYESELYGYYALMFVNGKYYSTFGIRDNLDDVMFAVARFGTDKDIRQLIH